MKFRLAFSQSLIVFITVLSGILAPTPFIKEQPIESIVFYTLFLLVIFFTYKTMPSISPIEYCSIAIRFCILIIACLCTVIMFYQNYVSTNYLNIVFSSLLLAILLLLALISSENMNQIVIRILFVLSIAFCQVFYETPVSLINGTILMLIWIMKKKYYDDRIQLPIFLVFTFTLAFITSTTYSNLLPTLAGIIYFYKNSLSKIIILLSTVIFIWIVFHSQNVQKIETSYFQALLVFASKNKFIFIFGVSLFSITVSYLSYIVATFEEYMFVAGLSLFTFSMVLLFINTKMLGGDSSVAVKISVNFLLQSLLYVSFSLEKQPWTNETGIKYLHQAHL